MARSYVGDGSFETRNSLSDVCMIGPISRANRTVPKPMEPPISSATPRTTNSTSIRVRLTLRPDLPERPSTNPSRGPAPIRAPMYTAVPRPSTSMPSRNWRVPATRFVASGNQACTRSRSIHGPTSAMLQTVPIPGRTSKANQLDTISRAPAACDTRPKDHPSCALIPS